MLTLGADVSKLEENMKPVSPLDCRMAKEE